MTTNRSSPPQMFFKIGVVNMYINIGVLGSTWLKSLLIRSADLLEKRLQHRCFPVKIAKFLRTNLLWTTCSGCFSTSYAKVGSIRYLDN